MSSDSAITAEAILARYNWRKVAAPQAWRAKYSGDSLVGFYGGKSKRKGHHGDYEVIIVHVPQRGALLVSGIRIIQLVDAAGIIPGAPVRVVYLGMLPLADERTMKDFDLFIPDDQQPLAAEHLPEIQTQ